MQTTEQKPSERIQIAPVIDLAPEGLAGVGSVFGRTRVRTLVSLRWMAVIGQVAAVLFTEYVLKYPMPLAWCLAVISVSAWLNVVLMAMHTAQRLASQEETAFQSAFDVVQLTILLALTGGVDNPFAFMIVAPVTVAASRLRPRYAILLLLLGVTCLGILYLFSNDLPWKEGETFYMPELYRRGLLASILIGLVFFAVSAWRTGRDEARLVRALEAAEEVLAKEQRLSALGALSAATAHELGTPLATIHLVARELQRATPKDSETYEDVALIAEQAERCRNILGQISRRGEASDAAHAKLPVSALIKEISEPHMGLGINVQLTYEPLPEASEAFQKPPEVLRRPEIIHALGAFVENAVSFANQQVHVAARWSDDELRVYIIDDGPGFSASVLPKLGEPYLSQRGEHQRGGGMGLGFFIARTLLERTGARIKPYNRRPPSEGAVVRVSWRLNTIQAAPGWTNP